MYIRFKISVLNHKIEFRQRLVDVNIRQGVLKLILFAKTNEIERALNLQSYNGDEKWMKYWI